MPEGSDPLYVNWRTGVPEPIDTVPPDGSITTAKLADGAVTTPKIADEAVTNAKLADMAEATFKGRARSAGTGVPSDLLMASYFRELLTANRTYYVATAAGGGDNSNDGLTALTPFLTVQKAIDVACALDLSIYNVTISVADGTYTTPVVLASYVGVGPITIQGNLVTPANVIFSTTSADAIYGNGVIGRWVIKGMQLQTTTSGNCIKIENGTVLDYGTVVFAACASSHIQVNTGSFLNVAASYTISAGASVHWNTFGLTNIQVLTAITITLTGTPAWGARMVNITDQSNFFAFGITFAGAATGQRFTVFRGSGINTGGGGVNFFPGNVAGTTDAATFCYYV